MPSSLSASALKALLHLLNLLPPRLAGAFGAGLGRAAWLVDARHRRIAERNLARLYPHKPAAFHRRIARESFAELGRSVFEFPAVMLRGRERLLARMEIEGLEAVQAALAGKRGVIINACHHSNWELGGLALSMLGLVPCHVIYRPLNQAGPDTLLKQARERFGAVHHSRHDGLRWLPAALRKGETIAVMVDQHQSTGEPIPFWGHDACSTTLPAVFGRKYRVPQFGVALMRQGRAFRFTLRFWPIELPEPLADREADIRQCMIAITDSFKPLIDERPELWLWIHRRWLYLDQREEGAHA